jgi:putative aldouronate transport system substrate-binding protein
MQTKRIRRTALLLVSVMIIALMAACSGGNKESATNTASNSNTDNKNTETNATESASTEVKDPVKLKIFAAWLNNPLNNSVPSDPVMVELAKKTGVTLDFEPYTGGGDHNAKLSVLLASDDLPDIIITDDTSMVNKLIQSKQVLPLDDLIKTNGPNVTANFQEVLDRYKVIYPNDNNKNYFIKANIGRTETRPDYHNNAWSLRWDLYKKLGQPKVDTLDEYLDVIKQMQALEPTNKEGKKNYGFGLNLGDTWGIYIVSKATMNAQGLMDGKPTHLLDLNKDELVPFIHDPNGKMWDVLKFYNKALQEGVLDPESVTMKNSNVLDKAAAGRYMSMQAGWLGPEEAEKNFIKEGTPEKGYVSIPVWMNSGNTYLTPENALGNQFYTMISTKSKHPERAMDLLDFLSTSEGYKLIQNGPEGIGWDMVDGKPVLKPEAIALQKSDNDKFAATIGAKRWGHLSLFGSPFDSDGARTDFYSEPALLEEIFTSSQKDFMKEMGYAYPTEGLDKTPNNTFTTALLSSISPPAGSDLASMEASLDTYIGTATAAVIYSKTDAEFEKGKEKLISEMKKMGADEVFKFYHDKYEEIKGNN